MKESEQEFPIEDWIKVGTGETTGFRADYKISGTDLTISYDVGDTFWNMSAEQKYEKAIGDAIEQLKS